jgi:uncharacterized membrane protein
MREREAGKRYLLELGGALLLYMAVLVASIYLAKSMQPGLGRTLVVIAPVIPVMLFFWVIARHFGRMDEFVRLRSLESMAISSGVVGAFSLTYGFFEMAGFPRLSMFVVWGILGASAFGVGCVRWLVKR